MDSERVEINRLRLDPLNPRLPEWSQGEIRGSLPTVEEIEAELAEAGR